MNTLRLRLKIRMEEREDRWAGWSEDFGFFAYGHTRDEAEDGMLHGVTTLVNSFRGDDEKLREFLDKKGADYKIYDTEEETPGAISHRLEVLVGSAA